MKLDSVKTRKVLAALLMLIGLMGMITAWSSLFITGSTEASLVEELGGVALALGGYMLWLSAGKMKKALKEEPLQESK